VFQANEQGNQATMPCGVHAGMALQGTIGAAAHAVFRPDPAPPPVEIGTGVPRNGGTQFNLFLIHFRHARSGGVLMVLNPLKHPVFKRVFPTRWIPHCRRQGQSRPAISVSI
jgi:hypothetical protein